MRLILLLLLILSFPAFSVCPLNLSPDEACPEDNPICTLYADDGGDGLCDNPGSGITDVESDTIVVEDTAAVIDSIDLVDTDTIAVEYPTDIPDTVSIDTIPGISADEGDAEESDDLQQFADNIEEQNELPESTIGPESIFVEIDSFEAESISVTIAGDSAIADTVISVTITGDSGIADTVISVTITGDSGIADTVITEQIEVTFTPCPLKLTPEEACSADNPLCTFFNDEDDSGFCDNPENALIVSQELTDESNSAYALEVETSGCPLGLTPETACPSPDTPLCPHYKDYNGCINPSGGGIKRVGIVLVGTFLLLLVSSLLNHFLRGRTRKDRQKRRVLHFFVQIVSLLVLGFFVQACYCPLGTMQYLLLPGELGFLGGMGIAILVLPLVWALFFGRIYCGWVCPFGALQDFLGKLSIPRPPKLSRKIHKYLVVQKYILTVLFLIAVFLAGRGLFGRIIPGSLFCQIDPFHTIFSFFLVGSLTGGVLLLCGMLFFPRFFCKYFCFYGAFLSLFSRHNFYHESCEESPDELPPWDSKKDNLTNS